MEPYLFLVRHVRERAPGCFQADPCVTYDYDIGPGWRHLAAVKNGGLLELYVDGSRVDTSDAFGPSAIATPRPL